MYSSQALQSLLFKAIIICGCRWILGGENTWKRFNKDFSDAVEIVDQHY